MRYLLPVVWVVLGLVTVPLRAADWPQFRGENRDGVSAEKTAPLVWGPGKNIVWQQKLPVGGNSSPIVSRGKVFLTCAEDKQGRGRSLYCFDRVDGKVLWKQTVRWEMPDPTHGQSPYCASTPAADGERVAVFHGSAGVICYDYEGKQLWSRDLGIFRHIWGYASSPVIWGDRVYLNAGPGDRSFVIALDKLTGQELWRFDYPGAFDKSAKTKGWIVAYDTVVPATLDGRPQVVVALPGAVHALDAATGKVIWTCAGLSDFCYGDVLLGDGVAVALSGYAGPGIGFRPGGSGDITAAARRWRVEKNPQRVGSGVMRGGHVYIASEPSIQCIDVATGQEVWRHRPAGETFWGSITAVGDRLYVTSQKGTTYVFAADPKGYRELAANTLGEMSNSTPAVSEGRMFLRTWQKLYCVGQF